MRVGLVCPYSLDVPGGVATHVLGFADWLVGEGHDVTVVAPGTGTPPATAVQVVLLGQSTPVRFNGSVARLALRPNQARAARAALRDADVVHVHEPLTPGVGFAVARSSPRLVVTHHAAFHLPGPASSAVRLGARLLPPRASVAVSRAAAATAAATTGVHPVVIPNAIAIPAPPAAPEEAWRGGTRPRIGFLGRLDEPRKGFAVFSQLAELALDAGVEADFIAIGPGNPAGGPIRHAGAVSDAERLRLLRTVDVLVAPNLGGESFGLVIIEAMAAGCDVVASDLPAFDAVIGASGVGELFPAGDAVAALASVRRRLADPLHPMAAHRAAEQWGWGRIGPRLLAILRERACHDALG